VVAIARVPAELAQNALVTPEHGSIALQHVSWAVIATVEIAVVAMRARCGLIDFVSQVPLVRKSMRGIQMPVDWLVNHLIAAHEIAIERH
jgi:hypothetical protein